MRTFGICLAIGSGIALSNIFGMEWTCIDWFTSGSLRVLQPLACALSPLIYWIAVGLAAMAGCEGLKMIFASSPRTKNQRMV